MKPVEEGTIVYVRLAQEDIVGQFVSLEDDILTLSNLMTIVPQAAQIRKISGVNRRWQFLPFATCMPTMLTYDINLRHVITFRRLEGDAVKDYEGQVENTFNTAEEFLDGAEGYETIAIDEDGWDGEPEIPVDFDEDDEFQQG